MATIADIKKQYPDLGGLDDDQVVDALHQAFYADLPREQVASSLGVKPAPAPVESSGLIRRIAGDGILTAVKGAIGVPEAAVGLADIATGGYAGKLAEDAGFRPKEAKAMLDEYYSPEQKAAFAAVQNAANKDDPFLKRTADIAGAAIRNPSTIVHAVGESLPSIGAGGVIGRGVMAMAPKAAGWAAAGIGEGVVSAGSTAEQVRQGTKDGLLTGEQSLVSAGSGALTGGLGMLAGRVASKMGIGDIDTLIVGGKHVDPALQKGFVRQLIEGAVSEGLMEELPQSVQEQIAQNYALGKPLDDGLDQATVMGVLTGGAMGMGAQVIHRQKVPEVGPLSRGANLAGGAVPNAPVVPPAVPPAGAVPAAAMPATGPAANPIDQTQALIDESIVKAAQDKAAQRAAMGITAEELPPEAPGQVATLPAPAPVADAEGSVSNGTLPAPEVATLPPASAAELPQPTAEAFAQREQDRPADTFGAVMEGDILNSQGKPFTTMPGAMSAQRKAGENHEIVRVDGGLVVRPINSAVTADLSKVPDGTSVQAPGLDRPAATRQDSEPGGSGVTSVAQSDSGRTGNVQDHTGSATGSGQVAPVPLAGGSTDAVAPTGNVATPTATQPQGMPTSSWVIREKATGKVILETFDKAKVDALNTEKYEAVPIVEHLSGLSSTKSTQKTTDSASTVAQAPAENPEWQRMPHADRLALNTRAGMSKLVADKIARTPWADITPKTRAKIEAAMVDSVRGSQTENAAPEATTQPATAKKRNPASNARKAAYDKNPLMTFVATHGLFHDKDKPNSLKSEYSPDKAIMVPGYGVVFKKTGHNLDTLTHKAIEEGYLPKDGTSSQLSELIRRAVSGEKISPMYAEGVAESIAQAQIDQQYQDFLDAEQERAQRDDYDPFESLADLDYALHDAELAGYDEASDPVKIEVNALLAQAEALGIDTDTIKENAHEATKNGSEQDYYDAARAALNQAIETGHGNSSQDAGSEGHAPSQEGLTSPTPADILAQQERADKAAKAEKAQRAAQELQDKKDRERKDIAKASEGAADTFTLGGDAMENLTGQTDIFSAPAPSKNTIFTDDAAAKAREILKKKLNGTLNSGIDPELLQAGITLAGYHIEKGARTFAAYAKAMIADLGDNVKPYLKSWYMGVKYDPRASGFAGMDGAALVEAAELDSPKAEESPIVAKYPSVEGTEIHVIKNRTGYAVNLWDSDAQEYMPNLRMYSGPDALEKATAYAEGIQKKADPQPAPKPAPAPEAAPTPAMVEHVTAKGKTLRGVIRNDITYAEAKAIDKYTFKKDGGYFIREEHLDALSAAHPKDAVATPAVEATPHPAGTLTNFLLLKIESGNMPKDNPALRKMVESFDDKPATPERMKEAQEAMEAAIVRSARMVVAKKEGPRSTFDALVRLYASQPNLNIRTSTSIENQAYSTPAPLAFVASELAGITDKTTVFEPTAGNGMLLIGAKIANATTNELNDDRVAALRDQGFKPTQKDATEGFEPIGDSMDAVITNPPFGPIKDKDGNSIKVKVDGYTIGQIDHLIAARALQVMKADGKATLIIGANKVTGEQSNNDLIFFNWLYGNYNVTSHFEVDGDLYQRQGASWPVRVITIEGRNKSSTTAPLPGTIQRASTWSQVYEQFQNGLGAQRTIGQPGTSTVSTQSGPKGNDQRPVPAPASGKTGSTDSSGSKGSTSGNGNVGGTGAGTVLNRPTVSDKPVGDGNRAGGNTDANTGTSDNRGNTGAGTKSDNSASSGTTALTSAENQFQTKYIPRSARKDEGVLIPVNMAGPTQDALNRLEDAVGDIDEFARTELGYDSVQALHDALMGLQVDSVASAIHQIKNGKGIIIADQTGIGKGRQAASILRWAAKNGKIPVFVTVKPSLFTDMFGDLHDIGTDDIAPFILNKDESIKGKNDEKLFANRAKTHTATMTAIAQSGELPKGTNALFMTYSQINTDNIQRKAVLSLAPNAVFVLDESHNAGGESATGGFIRDAIGLAHGVTYLSATYAKRPDNMPVYFKTDMGDAVADDATLMNAMAQGGLPLQTVVANNLVKAGQMFRRERSYDGVNIESRADTEHRAEHVKMSDTTTLALRAIVAADSAFHHNYFKALQKELEKSGAKVMDIAGNQAQASVDHTQFSSVVHNFVRQMLLGLKAQEAANDAIRSLKRGEKPIIAVENTMGSFLNEYAENNGLSVGDQLGAFTYRTVLSRALERSRYIVRQLPNGDKVKEYIPLGRLDPVSYEAYSKAQDIIDGLKIDIPVSPIDWMRQEITNAGYSVAEITGRNLSVDYSDPKNPKLSQIDTLEQKDKVRTTRNFNAGKLDAMILNVAGSTGISLHASEKFKDQSQRHMIVAQAAQDINVFMQMLGRIHRTGQVVLPKYTLLSADLPAEIRPTALLSGKMKSLNANTSSNTESATSVKSSDMLNKYGDQLVAQYLRENQELALAMGLDIPSESGDGAEDIARKATGRLALMPVKVQEQFYADIEEQYTALIDFLNKTNQNELEPKTFDFEAQETRAETMFEGQNKESPFGEDAYYGEYSVKAQGKAMTPEEIKAVMTEHLGGKTSTQHIGDLQDKLETDYAAFIAKSSAEARDNAGIARANARRFMNEHKIGDMFRVEINQENYNAVITNIRNTHKAAGNPYAMSKFQVTVAVNGSLRSVTVPATQFNKIETSRLSGYGSSIEREFRVGATNERETAKIITGNLLGAYGEMEGTRGSIITFSKADGTTEQGILLPKTFNFAKDVRQDYRIKTPADVFKFVTQSSNENIGRFGINSRDGIVRVMPSGNNAITIQVPKSKAKGGKFFLDKKLLAATGDFTSQGNFMRATVEGKAASVAALGVLMDKQALYALPSMAEEARNILGDAGSTAFSRQRAGDNVRQGGQPAGRVQSMVDMITSRWANAPKVIVVQNLDDPRVPDGVRLEGKAIEAKVAGQTQSVNKAGNPEGFFDGTTGTVFMIADALRGDADVVRVLMHESLGHYGMRNVFGTEFGTILDRMAVLNADKVRNAAKRLGLDYENKEQRKLAAEEVLAYMAQKVPEIGWVKQAIAAIRTWARDHIPGFSSMKITDDELIRNYIIPARNWVEKGGPTGGGGGNVATQTAYSRNLGEALTNIHGIDQQKVRNTLSDLMGNAGAKVSWWDKTLGTQYAKAQKFPEFKKVFDSVQTYIEGVSTLANEAANEAPTILPKLETWRDLKNFGIKPEDAKAIAAPVFEGTLNYARDNGKLVKVDDLIAEAEKLTTEEKGRRLMKDGHFTEAQLKAWRASPLDIHDKAVENRYEQEYLRPGTVFTADELRSVFKLNDAQIGQYQQFRATVDKSLDQVVAAEVLRLIGDAPAELKALAMSDRAKLREALDGSLSETDTDLYNDILDKYAKVDRLKAHGYAPLMRFGKYKVHIADSSGETLFFGLYETRQDANRMARELAQDPDFAGMSVQQGVLSQEAYKLFGSVPVESLEMFADAIGADKAEVYQQYLRLTKNNRSALKRLIHRKGTDGFSDDVPRVLASFVTSNAWLASGSMNLPAAQKASQDIKDGDVKDEAVALVQTVQNPVEAASAVRGLMFMNFIGGSIASAVVNVTQPITMTLPYLTQFGGPAKAFKRLMEAGKIAASGKGAGLELSEALKRAENDGIVSPQEIHHLQAQAMATWGTNPFVKRASFIWSAPFSLAEQWNRRVSFIAAYQTAKQEGIANPFDFAEKAVIETQGLYNKGNAPNLARGAVGAMALQFKQFSIHYLEWMGRMWNAGEPGSKERADGRRAVLIAIAMLMLFGGADGLPFADDIDDLADTLTQSLGFDASFKRGRRKFIADTLGLGEVTADVMARGLSSIPGVPMDVSLRMGMGNLLPATGILLRSNTDRSRDLMEIAGPVGGLGKQYLDSAQKALRGDVSGATINAMPTAAQNVAKAIQMWTTGEARDDKGRKVMNADSVDGLMKFLGFNPADIARESQAMGMIRRSEQLDKNVEGEIVERWARGIVDKEPDAVKAARESLADWNKSNPTQPIRITLTQVIQRAKKMRDSRSDRFIKSVAPERRAAVTGAL